MMVAAVRQVTFVYSVIYNVAMALSYDVQQVRPG